MIPTLSSTLDHIIKGYTLPGTTSASVKKMEIAGQAKALMTVTQLLTGVVQDVYVGSAVSPTDARATSTA